MGDLFDELAAQESLVYVAPDTESIGPPWWAAFAAVALGVISIGASFTFKGSAGWIGWGIGLAGVVSGVVFRAIVRKRQMFRLYLPNSHADRLMLFGVLLGFVGILLNAIDIAQRVIK